MEYAVQGAIKLNMTSLRLLRIFKISRLVRIIRVVRIFRELRIMVMSIVSTLRTLMWSLVCLFLIMSGIGSYFAWVFADTLASGAEESNSEVLENFGSMTKILTSLFQATTGGRDWRELSDILCRISPFSCFIFYGYISMMVYAINNILTGICVANANRAADDDMELSSEEIMKDVNVARLRGILGAGPMATRSMGTMDFGAVMSTRSVGTKDFDAPDRKISWAQLKVHLGDPIVRGYFKKLDLEPWHLRSFFMLLKVGEEEPEINVDNFIRGCMRLRCNVKNIDLMAALHENKAYDTRRYDELMCSVRRVSGLVSQLEQKKEVPAQNGVHQWVL